MNSTSAAIIVTYNPDITILDEFIEVLLPQVTQVLIIDNSEPAKVLDYPGVEVIRLNDNIGIAAAQNIGVQKAIDRGYDFVFTFDQDSRIASTFCRDMIEEYQCYEQQYPIACLGPVINQQSQNKGLIEKDFIISSGALFPLQAFKDVGLFKSEWFIDMIDVEWSYRARTKGLLSFESTRVLMHHNIGENDYPRLFNREVRIGSPVRQYYLVRNWIFSLKSESFTTKYKFYVLTLLLKKIPLFALLAPRKTRIKFIIQGLLDGIMGKGGKYSS
ncbi:glycosyltransferase family 2 protein [Superficieibacter sp. BNK-5]|uniref:glycosyltransferase family 2 protein n=1 Tax=Superficieibacter sp. BNK-5 TaxID=3376142 RepID=UPI0039BF9929